MYVSTVWALGPSGHPPETALPKDETQSHDGNYLSAYERSKTEAHQAALAWRAQGLPLVIAMPNAVVGANDHAVFGYFLRLYLLHGMPPMASGGDTVMSMVDVLALADGLCRAAEAARTGEDYLFCGEPLSIRGLFNHWGRYPGGMVPRLWLPCGLMYWPMARHLKYSAAKAHRDLGWSHPSIDVMWERIIGEERALMKQRRGFLNKLRHQATV